MKLVTFSVGSGLRVGLTDGEHVADLTARLSTHPRTMIELIERWDDVAGEVRAIGDRDHALADVRLHAPIPRPGKIYALGLNYRQHVAEMGRELPAHQTWFTKPGTAVNGPYDPVQRPKVSEQLDYEVELVVVIGKRCRHVPAEKAQEVIFGYCVGNDVSVRDWQTRTQQFVIGKSFDTHAPFGPWIETSDGVDAGDLDLRLLVNGEERQHSNTRDMIFDCAAQVADLSTAMTLEPGDVIFTGTPSGVAAGMRPPRWLQAGDRVRAEISGIGHIEALVVDEVAEIHAPE